MFLSSTTFIKLLLIYSLLGFIETGARTNVFPRDTREGGSNLKVVWTKMDQKVCESARLPPMCPGFDSRTRRHMWAEFVGSLLCSERFFSGNSGFPPSS